MAEAEETKHCNICSKDIEVSKYRMHDIGCSRQNYKCKECGECVPKAEREEHEEEAHNDIICQYCDFKAPKFKYLDHDDKCKKKPSACEFCGKEIPFYDQKDHY
jgi:DNA-directed RNA polymerase subunit RPC12/RpoP